MKGDYDSGIEWLQARDAEENGTFFIRCLGDLYLAKGDCDGAIKCLRKAITRSNRVWIMPTLFQACVAREDYEGAMAEFENVFVVCEDLRF